MAWCVQPTWRRQAADQVGGVAATREFAPGYRASVAHLLYLLDKDISKELALESHGLRMAKDGLKTIALAENGNHVSISAGSVDGADLSNEDKAAYREYRRFMTKFAGIFSGLHNKVPPRITRERSDFIALGKMALNVRMLGRDDMRELLRIGAINIYDVLKENFDDPLLRGALSLDAVLGTNSGPRSNNSVFTALHRMSGNNSGAAGDVSIPYGGMGAVTEALAAAAHKAGAEIRTGSPVSSILVDGDNIKGVQLASGEQIAATVVVSNADPKTTMMSLLGARHLEAGFARKFGNIACPISRASVRSSWASAW